MDARPIFRFAEFTFDPAEARLERDGEPVPAQAKVLAALEILAGAGGRLVPKEELLARLWPDTFVSEEALTQVMRKLRVALGDDPRAPRFVETVAKRGYRFVALPPPSPARGQRHRRWAGAAASLLALALASLAFWSLVRRAAPPEPLVAGRLRRARLTSTPGREQEAVFSPDGARYAFAGRGPGGDFDVFLADFAGGGPVRLTRDPADETYPQFAPDGRALSFHRAAGGGAGAIWSVAPLGGAERLLVSDAVWGTWSPDAREIAFARPSGGGGWSVRRRRLADGREREVAVFPGWIASLAWSPDGRLLALTDERALWTVSSAGGEPRQVGPRAHYLRSLAWEPSSRALLCDASWAGEGANDLWRVRLGGGGPEPLTSGPGGLFHPAVAADGRRILYTAEHKSRQLVVADARGGGARALDVQSTIECADAAPDGSWAAFSDWDPRPGATSLGLLDLRTLALRPLGEGLCPAISTDGRRLAFLGARPEEEGLWVLDLATGARRRVASGLGPPGFIEQNLARRPAWTPGGALVVPTLGQPGGDGLLLVDPRPAGAAGRRVLARGRFGPPAVSPDGRWLAASLAGGEQAGLHLIDLASGSATRISSRRSYRAAPLFSRDGASLRLLVDEQRAPALLELDLRGRELAPPLRLAVVPEPGFWGVFDVDALTSGWLYLQETYEGDLYLLAPR